MVKSHQKVLGRVVKSVRTRRRMNHGTMVVSLTYPLQRSLLALWGRWCHLCECHLGTRLPCFLQPDDQRLPLKYTHVYLLHLTCAADLIPEAVIYITGLQILQIYTHIRKSVSSFTSTNLKFVITNISEDKHCRGVM